MRGIPIGTVSCGTLRDEDLIEAYTSFLEAYAPDRLASIRQDHYETYQTYYKVGVLPWEDYVKWREEAAYLIDALTTALELVAPDGYYFGSHPGDGAEFGFWRVDEE